MKDLWILDEAVAIPNEVWETIMVNENPKRNIKTIFVDIELPEGYALSRYKFYKEKHMKQIEVKSSNLKSIGYDAETKTLVVVFKNGASYSYEEVSAKNFCLLLFSESIGKFFNKVIKPHKFTKL